jgi:hypothetical protein
LKLTFAELYRRHRDTVFQLSLAIQNYDGKTYTPPPLSDKAIAEKIGLTAEEVREIRCLAEADALPASVWAEADVFKNERAKKFRRAEKI